MMTTGISLRPFIERARSLKRQGKFPFVFEAYRLLRIFQTHFKNSCQELICFISVTLRFPWAYAYCRMGGRFQHKLFRIIDSDDYQKDVADHFYYRAMDYFERACHLRPNFVEAAQLMSAMALTSGRSEEWLTAQHRVIAYQEKRAQLAGVEKHNFRIIEATPIFSTIGTTLTLDAWIKSGILGLRPNWRSLILVEPSLKGRAANQCLLDYWKTHFEFVEDPVKLSQLRPLVNDLRALHNYSIPCGEKIVPFSHSAAVWIQAEWEKQERQPLLQLTEEHRQQGWDMLEHMGMPRDAWFVTSHVRESGFKGKESWRDTNVAIFFEAYSEVTTSGGWVVRLGDASMEPLPPMPQVIDYALSDVKSDWMDVFLLAAARFMIGTESGPSVISYIFGVPVAMTNYTQSATLYLTSKDLFLPRLLRSIDDHRILNFEEQMVLPYSMACWDPMITNVLGVETIPNTSEEITELVREMLNKLDGTLFYTEEEEALQQRFKTLTAECEVMIGLPGFEIQCRVGRSFLRQHQHLFG